jgi:hypothetical protein
LSVHVSQPYAGDFNDWAFTISLTDYGGVYYWTHFDLIANVGPQGHELPGFSLAVLSNAQVGDRRPGG